MSSTAHIIVAAIAAILVGTYGKYLDARSKLRNDRTPKEVDFKPSCRLFYNAEKEHWILMAMNKNQHGVYFEGDLIYEGTSAESAISSIGTALNGSKIVRRDLSGRKKSDWPAFRHSKMKSVKEFEKTYRLVDLAYEKTTGLYELEKCSPDGKALKIEAKMVPNDSAKLKEAIIKICAEPILR